MSANLPLTDVDSVAKRITEIKKRIRLSEGQRKASYQEFEAEKQENAEKIKKLKQEIKGLYREQADLGFEQTDKFITTAYKHNFEEYLTLKNKTAEETVTYLDLRVTDMKKKLDLLHHQSRELQRKIKKLAMEHQQLLQKQVEDSLKGKGSKHFQRISTLENKIHQLEISIMEAEHIRRRYVTIRGKLLDDSGSFEKTLEDLEKKIQKQDAEIQQLENIKKEASDLRDSTKGTLISEEVAALNLGKDRERKLEDMRHRLESRRHELEVLGRKIFPSMAVFVRESQSDTDTSAPISEEVYQTKTIESLEKALNKLKMATGEKEVEELYDKFVSQKETKDRLMYLKDNAEKQKKTLEQTKEALTMELEKYKFAEVKDKEQNAEEQERIKHLIELHKRRKEEIEYKTQKLTQQLLAIKNILYKFCLSMEKVDEMSIPPPSDDITSLENIIITLKHKIKTALKIIGEKEGSLDDILSKMDEPKVVGAMMPLRLPEDIQHHELADLSADKLPTVISDSGPEDEEVLTRGHIKRYSQMVLDAKTRKRYYGSPRAKK